MVPVTTIVNSHSVGEHWGHLKEVLRRLQGAGLRVNPGKCVFGVGKVRFLGHEISAEGQRPLEIKVAPVLNFSVPTTVRELRSFLGFVSYYRRFVPKLAHILQPLDRHLLFEKKSQEIVAHFTLAE